MTWAPAIDVENASAHSSTVSIGFNEGILIVTSSRNLPLAATEDIPSFCLKTMGTKVAQEPSAACSWIVGYSEVGPKRACGKCERTLANYRHPENTVLFHGARLT